MAVRFALRSRIVLREEPERTRAVRLPQFALPVASYWAIMGLLTYGIASGALRPERFTSFHGFPKGSFESGRLAPVATPDTARPALEAPARPAATVDEAPPAPAHSEEPIAANTAAPQAPAAPEVAAPSPSPTADDAVARAASKPPSSSVRPLAGFSLTQPYSSDGYDDAVARFPDTPADTPSRQQLAHRDAEEGAAEPPARRRVARRDSADDAPAPPREREIPLLVPDVFQPAARRPAANQTPKVAARSGSSAPWFPDIYDDGSAAPRAPAPPAPAPRERAPERPVEKEPVRAPAAAPASVGSCEAAAAAANDVIDMNAGRGPADITRGAYGSLLERGGYLMPCHVPDGMALDICAAVRDGRPVGITVVSRPADSRVQACVRNAVAALPWPKSPRLDITHTRFNARGK